MWSKFYQSNYVICFFPTEQWSSQLLGFHPDIVFNRSPSPLDTRYLLWAQNDNRFHVFVQGVLEAIRISCAGYPTRRTFYEFLDRFGFLAPEVLEGKWVTTSSAWASFHIGLSGWYGHIIYVYIYFVECLRLNKLTRFLSSSRSKRLFSQSL